MNRALASRAEIEQAKGAIMSVFGLDGDAAFASLVRVSQQANVKLAIIARQFVAGAQQLDAGAPQRDQVTQLLATLSTSGKAEPRA
jgi:hypothetical protein